MRARICVLSLLLALPAALAASAADPAPAPPLTLWHAGEQLQFTAGLGIFTSAATLEVETLPATGRPRPDRLRLLATVRSGALVSSFYPFFYRHICTVSGAEMLPRSGSRQTREGEEQWFLAFRYDHADSRVRLSTRAGGPPLARDAIATDTHDLLSALYHFRGQAPGPEARFTVYENRSLYRVSARLADSTNLQVAAGSFPAWHYVLTVDPLGDPLTDPEIHVWISRGEERLPLRLTASTLLGDLTLELSDWEPAAPSGAGDNGRN
jgi:hypothetical protein